MNLLPLFITATLALTFACTVCIVGERLRRTRLRAARLASANPVPLPASLVSSDRIAPAAHRAFVAPVLKWSPRSRIEMSPISRRQRTISNTIWA